MGTFSAELWRADRTNLHSKYINSYVIHGPLTGHDVIAAAGVQLCRASRTGPKNKDGADGARKTGSPSDGVIRCNAEVGRGLQPPS